MDLSLGFLFCFTNLRFCLCALTADCAEGVSNQSWTLRDSSFRQRNETAAPGGGRAEDDVVEHGNAEQRCRLTELRRRRDVRLAGRRVAGRMVVRDDDFLRAMPHAIYSIDNSFLCV